MTRKKKGETVETLTEAPGVIKAMETEALPEAPKTPRQKRLDASYNANTGIIKMEVIGGEQGVMEFDTNELSTDTLKQGAVFGIYKTMGTQGAMSAKTGIEAEKAVIERWEAHKKGQWKTRATGGAKKSITFKSVADKLGNLSPEDQAAAIEQLLKIGIELPQAAPVEAA